MWATEKYGIAGAGWVWVAINTIYLFFWIPFIHHVFLSNFHCNWIKKEILPITFMAFSTTWVTTYIPWPEERIYIFITLTIFSILIFLISSMGSSLVRQKIYFLIKK